VSCQPSIDNGRLQRIGEFPTGTALMKIGFDGAARRAGLTFLPRHA
jgi:hypothetical protein